MKKVTNMTDLFEKLDDLKSVFHYGEKLIPIIQSIIEFMRETVPLLENINSSIEESTNKIPKATHQIINVTNATEIATTEILDLVDEISNNLYKAKEISKHISDQNIKRKNVWEKIKVQVKDQELINEYENTEIDEKVAVEQENIFTKIQEEIYRITLSLQVQDITAQQLAAVNHLIGSVNNRLGSLITDFQKADIKDPGETFLDKVVGAAFDPNARYHHKKEAQDIADSLVNNQYEKTSQAEIDKLFS
jgi:chemotaxis regulatin CheY-phosphate phosphatase CheZ